MEDGLDAVLCHGNRGRYRLRAFDGEGEAHLIALACSEPPAGRTRWTLRLLADRVVELGGLGDFEKDVIEAIGDDSMQAEAISQAIGQDNNSHFRGKLAAMVKRRILRSDRSGGNGYRVLPPFNRLYK